jgi:ribosome recycling factor
MPTIEKVSAEDGRRPMEAVRREFGTVRTGKATPALLDTVGGGLRCQDAVEPGGHAVSTPEASLLVVQPFDRP